MRRAATGTPSLPPVSNGSTSTAPSSSGPTGRRGKRRGLSTSTGSFRTQSFNNGSSQTSSLSSSYYPWIFVCFALILVLADLLYLYKLSSQALMDDPNHSSTWKASHLSRVSVTHVATSTHQRHNVNGTVIWYGPAKNVHGSKNNIDLPALPDNHVELEAHHHKQQMAVHRNRSPPQPLTEPDMLHQQAKERGLHNLNDKGPILNILQQAGLHIDDLDQESVDKLPTWTQIQTLYGPEPRVMGLELCGLFRESVPAATRFFGVAGVFNSGTNLVAELMAKNCQITERMETFGSKSKGIRWQVPWGKHYPASFRGVHGTKTDKDVPHQNTLPLVVTREPYMWLQSMCRHHYEMRWPHDASHCPNLMANEDEIRKFPWLSSLYLDFHNNTRKDTEFLVPINIKFQDRRIIYKSLAHFWTEWYQLYVDALYPRIMVRFEDLLFYGQEVTEMLCECGGGVPRDDRPNGRFIHISESAKLGTAAHGNHKTNLLGAIIKYGNLDHRLNNMTDDDLRAAIKYFDKDIMELFGYRHPDVSTL